MTVAPPSTAAIGISGFHGKLPARGDFVSYNLPLRFLKTWDGWLAAGLRQGANQQGTAWPARFAAAPWWRFALGAGLCGGQVAAGVMAPSTDRVGRPYPLTVAAILPPGAEVIAVPVAGVSWFGAAEQLAAKALDATTSLDFGAFIAEVRGLGAPAWSAGLPPAGRFGWRIGLESRQTPAVAYSALIRELVAAAPDQASLWWTLGNGIVEPMLLVCEGLPAPEVFPALVAGAAPGEGWCDLAETGPHPEDPVRVSA